MFSAFGQTESPDSVIMPESSNLRPHYDIQRVSEEYQWNYGSIRSILSSPTLSFSQTGQMTYIIPNLSFVPGEAGLSLWSGGGITAAGRMTEIPGLMHVDTGTLVLTQQLGNTTISLGGVANKYGYFHGVHMQYGLTGNVSYSIIPSLAITLFGTYYFGSPPLMANKMTMPHSMAGYYGVSNFGGYADYKINNNFGVQVGGQAIQKIGTNQYQFEPIVTPYVKVGKVGIGLPVGQIMNGVIRSRFERRSRNR